VPRTQVSLSNNQMSEWRTVTSIFWSCTQFFIPMKKLFCFMVVLFISSPIRRFGQFLFFRSHFWSPPTKAIHFGSPAAAGSICAVREQLLPVSICFSATRLPRRSCALLAAAGADPCCFFSSSSVLVQSPRARALHSFICIRVKARVFLFISCRLRFPA
jgi:hypothetical protein